MVESAMFRQQSKVSITALRSQPLSSTTSDCRNAGRGVDTDDGASDAVASPRRHHRARCASRGAVRGDCVGDARDYGAVALAVVALAHASRMGFPPSPIQRIRNDWLFAPPLVLTRRPAGLFLTEGPKCWYRILMSDQRTQWDVDVYGPGTETRWDVDVYGAGTETLWDLLPSNIGSWVRVIWSAVGSRVTWLPRGDRVRW